MSASLWSLVFRGFGAVLTFVLGVILARTLGPENLGVYGIVIAFASLLSVVGQLGLPTLSTREAAVACARQDWPLLQGVIASFAKVVLGASVVLGLMLGASAVFAPHFFGEQAHAFLIGSALVPLTALTILTVAILRGLGRTVLSQSIEQCVKPAITLCCLAMCLLLWGLNAGLALIVTAIAATITLVVGGFFLWRSIPAAAWQARPAYRRLPWIQAALPMAAIEVLRQVEGNYGILLIGALASDQQAGLFRLAFSTMLVVAIPLGVFHMVLAPTLARLSADREDARLRKTLAVAAFCMFLAAAFATLLLIAIGRPIIQFVFGEDYTGAWLPLVLLMLAQTVNGMLGVGPILLAMGGGETELTRAYLLSLVVGVAVAVPLIVSLGATGAAGATVLGSLVLNLCVWRAVRARYEADCSLFGAISEWRRT